MSANTAKHPLALHECLWYNLKSNEVYNMIQNRIITITDISRTPDGEETSKVITKGCMVGGPQDYTLHFSEMLDDEYTCDTRMHVKNRCCVSIVRTGAYNSEMIIEEGRRHNSHYVTPYGEFMIGIFAKSVESNISTGGGKLKMNYTIDFFGGLTAEKMLTIEVSAKTDSPNGKEKSGRKLVAKQVPQEEQ